MKNEIIQCIKDKHNNNSKLDIILKKVEEELSLMEKTTGLENKNNLKSFYEIWKKNKDKCGDKNEINSWTAYALGMTSKKPDGEFLPKRRAFARAGFPDIDTDFDYENRDKIYQYIIEKYGRENVGNIGTHGLLRFKSCVTKVVKALDIADCFFKGKEEYISKNVVKVNEILSSFPTYGILKIKDDEGNTQIIKSFDDAYKYSSDFRYYIDKYPDIGVHCRNIEETFANFGCLGKQTPILTNKGLVWISKIYSNKREYKVAFINKKGEIDYTDDFRCFKTGYKKTYMLNAKRKDHNPYIYQTIPFIDVTDEHLIFTDKGCTKFKYIRNNKNNYKIYTCMNNRLELNKIQSVIEMEKQDVYDISMSDKLDFFQNEHNYIANNIVVHNSHAAGMVVSNVPLDTIAPLRRASKGVLATQYPYEDLEALGLIKFDILAISTLSVIKRTLEMVKQNWDIDIDYKNIPLDDDNTFRLYRTGNLGGVFQCENLGMQKTMKEIGVDRFEDIVAGISLFRPGPMESIPQYCARKRGEEGIDYFHPSIEKFVKPYLEDTYGVICYQESVMQIVNALAGFSISDGYVMIKAIGKKKEELMNMFESQFVKGCVNNNVPENIAKNYWKKFIVPFSSYGFNRCLSGDMTIKNKFDGKIYTLEELKDICEQDSSYEVYLDSYCNGEIVEDLMVDVFETGEKDVYEIEMDNGIILKSTLDHKFICDDGNEHTLQEIIDEDLNVLFYKNKGNMKKCKVKYAKFFWEKQKTYNLTMKSKQHNYAIYDKNTNLNVITKNSHAACYGFTSYLTAYLKANYPDEFMCSLLNVTINSSIADKYEKSLFFEKEFSKKMNVKILPRSVNHSKIEYSIEKRKNKDSGIFKTEIRPSILCKGISYAAAENISDNQPFKDLTDFVKKTDISLVDSRSFEALIDSGYFGLKAKKNKDKMKKDFLMIKEDLKKVSKKGIEIFDMFNQK